MTLDDQLTSLPQLTRAVLILDVAEYVRLMEEDQHDIERRWRHVVALMRAEVIPDFGGRLVETRGDSLVVTFPQVQPAAQAAFAINRLCGDVNKDRLPRRHILLRMGIHLGNVFNYENELSGHTVNLAARLMSQLAGPGEVVASSDAREQLSPMLDADIEDLGDCYLKHISEPVRAYRIGPPGPRPVIELGTSATPSLRPTVAVIPFANRNSDLEFQVLGEVLADDIISGLSRSSLLNVTSRLSTTIFRQRVASLEDMGAHLKANYILSGKYAVIGGKFTATMELAEVQSGHIKWSESIKGQVADIISGCDELVDRVVAAIGNSVLMHELKRGQFQALPTLESYSLLMNAIVRMHGGSPQQFERAHQMLLTLSERVPNVALPYAWLAKWHVLRFNRGLSPDATRESQVALDCAQRALNNDPNCSLALTIDGFVHTNLLKRFDVAEARYTRALEVNPNESLAWLLKGTMHAFKGEGALAMEHTERALALSPLDPLRYFYESLAATAAQTAGHYDRAIELARQSRRANRLHPSTLRAMTIAQVLSGRMNDARETVVELLKIEPNLTVSGYLKNNPGGAFPIGKIWADALQQAGVPA